MCSCTSPGGISAMPDAGSSPFAKAPLPVGRRRWSERPLAQLILVRIREFAREPEAVFWTFLFPVLMTAGLGIAFRSKPEETTRVAVLAGAPAAQETLAPLPPGKKIQGPRPRAPLAATPRAGPRVLGRLRRREGAPHRTDRPGRRGRLRR